MKGNSHKDGHSGMKKGSNATMQNIFIGSIPRTSIAITAVGTYTITGSSRLGLAVEDLRIRGPTGKCEGLGVAESLAHQG